MALRKEVRTIRMVRLLRSLGPLRTRRGRMPRQQQPDAIRREYFNAINRAIVAPAMVQLRRAQHELVHILTQVRIGQGVMDATGEKPAQEVVARAKRAMERSINNRELHDIATRFGQRTSDWQREQFGKQVRAAMGVDLGSITTLDRHQLDVFVAENVSLIRSVDERLWGRIADDVKEAFETGMHPKTFAERLSAEEGVSESDAMRIARDQIGKLNAQVNQERQEDMGVQSYVWRTAGDNRVRDEHAERDGDTFSWDDPPEGGHPGEDICCRCSADPVFTALLGEIAE